MKIVEFKSKRLFWLLFIIPDMLFLFPNPYEYYLEHGIFYGLRGVLTVGGMIGCLFYSIGARVFTRKFWQVYLVLMVVDELCAMLFESQYGVFIYIFWVLLVVPYFIMLFLYAFRNTSIWKDPSEMQFKFIADESYD